MERKGYLGVPRQLAKDLHTNQIKYSEFSVWMILQEFGSHGEWFFMPEEEILKESRCKRTTLSTAISRLVKTGHIARRKTGRGMQTKLLTRARNGEVFYKGELKN